jgi:hypothetical protein
LVALPTISSAVRADIAYVTGGNTIYTWDTSINAVTPFTTTPLASLDSLIFDPQGNIIYNSFFGNQIGVYNPSTGVHSILVGPGRGLVGPADMALDPSGASFLVSNAGDGSIARVNLTTGAVTPVYTGGLRPDGLTYDNNGRLFAVLGLREVAQLDATTGAVLKTVSTPNQPDGLTFDATTGMLYVGSDGGGFYTVPTDLSTATFTSLPGIVVDGVASNGIFLYLVQRGVGALQYNLSTNTVTARTTSIPGADDIAPLSGLGAPPVAVIPEPGSIVLLGMGLAVLAGATRREWRN